MAVTINNFWGAETGGLEETTSVSGASASATRAHSGGYSYLTSSATNYARFDPFESVASAGTKCVVGFWYYAEDLIATGRPIMQLTDAVLNDFQIYLQTDFTLLLLDSAGVSQITGTTVLTTGVWHFIEAYVDRVDSGNAELFLDGISEGTASAKDFNGITGAPLVQIGYAGDTLNCYADDIYFMSGATAATDRLGGCEVFSYRSSENSTGADADAGAGAAADALTSGTWLGAQGVPFVDGSVALYGDTQAGSVVANDVGGSAGTGGPSTDANIDGDIVAAKGVWRMLRSGGGATAHYGLLGNSVASAGGNGDGTTRSADFAPTTGYLNYFMVSELTTIVPLSTEYSQIGFEIDGKQDFSCADMLAQVLHVPTPAATDPGIPFEPHRQFQHMMMR